MRPLLTPWRLLAAFLLLLLVLLGVAAQQFRLFERGLFILQEWRHASEWRERSIWLPDYRVDIEARPIEGLVDDVSALTYDPDRHSLFTVTNQRPEIIELSLDGHLIRRIPLVGFGDPEAIEYISKGVYVITDERDGALLRIEPAE